MRRTRVRRGGSRRRIRSARIRRRAALRHRPVRSRSRYGRSGRLLRWSLAKSLVAAAVAAAVVAAGCVVNRHDISAAFAGGSGMGTEAASSAAQFIYTARTANDAAITLPGAVQSSLRTVAEQHKSITLYRVDFSGNVSETTVDMTPRTGGSTTDPVLKVPSRIPGAIDSKITGIQNAIDSSAPGTGGGRALFAGLTKISFTNAPVTIISSGIDLANPDNFQSLRWSVTPEKLAAELKKAGALPVMHGRVTFVLVPTAGRQPQLAQAQKGYLESVWTALLRAAGATRVTFIDASGTTASPGAPSAPTVAVPGLPGTPVPVVAKAKGKATCTVSSSYFVFDAAKLIDTAKAEHDLAPCVATALAAHATFALDGWASYEGPLNLDGQPAVNEVWNRKLSEERVGAIADLLVNDLHVPRSAITRLTGHGNIGQPDPDPRSQANRVVVITYTFK